MRATLSTPRSRLHLTMCGAQEHGISRRDLPLFLNVEKAAELLRTTRRAIYAMVERRQLPGVVRLRRRVLFRADDLPDWLDQKRAPSPEESLAMSVTIRPYRNGGCGSGLGLTRGLPLPSGGL